MNDGEWISITDAAARLSAAGDSVDRSTLSRYLKQHAEALPLRRDGKSNLVEFGALAAHRAENVRLRRPPVQLATTVPGKESPFVGSKVDSVAIGAAADAEMKVIKLAELRGEITPIAEVAKQAHEAVALTSSAFDRAVDTEAAAASVKYGWDERVARLVLKAFARKGMDMFHREILKGLDGFDRERMALQQGDSQPAPERSLQ